VPGWRFLLVPPQPEQPSHDKTDVVHCFLDIYQAEVRLVILQVLVQLPCEFELVYGPALGLVLKVSQESPYRL
jgi:hypothetical protein